MKLKKKLLIFVGVVVAAAFVSGVSILAATSLGTQEDPLVTLSYLAGQLKPQIISEVNESIGAAEAELSKTLEAKVDAFKTDIDARLSGSSDDEADVFTLVTLSKNQTVTCGVGAEILLRVGTASAAGSTPALIDTTEASSLASGGALAVNHMYLVTIENNGLKATAATVKFLIRGDYTVA